MGSNPATARAGLDAGGADARDERVLGGLGGRLRLGHLHGLGLLLPEELVARPAQRVLGPLGRLESVGHGGRVLEERFVLLGRGLRGDADGAGDDLAILRDRVGGLEGEQGVLEHRPLRVVLGQLDELQGLATPLLVAHGELDLRRPPLGERLVGRLLAQVLRLGEGRRAGVGDVRRAVHYYSILSPFFRGRL